MDSKTLEWLKCFINPLLFFRAFLQGHVTKEVLTDDKVKKERLWQKVRFADWSSVSSLGTCLLMNLLREVYPRAKAKQLLSDLVLQTPVVCFFSRVI